MKQSKWFYGDLKTENKNSPNRTLRKHAYLNTVDSRYLEVQGAL